MIKERNEISNEYKWDLSTLYVNDEEFEKDFLLTEKLFNDILSFKGKILASKESLLETLNVYLKAELVLVRIQTYSKMKQDENTSDSNYQALNGRAESLGVKFSEVSSFILPEIISGDENLIKSYLKDDKLKHLTQYINNILRSRPHTLGEEAEAILAQAGEVLNTASNAYGMLSSADLKFPTIKDEDGKNVELTHGSFVPFLMGKNRDVRKEAFKKYYKVFEEHKNVFASLISSEVKKNIFNAKVRNHKTARASALFENNVPETVYDNLIEAVNNNLDAMHKYMHVRKKMLKLDTLRPYDIYVPLIEDVDLKFPFEEAKLTVLDSLKALGEEYYSVVKNSFTDGWIDVYETKGKRSGAYSWGMYDSKPYILLNYHDTLSDMFTLTHEMGHSMHSYYTRKNQDYIYGEYSIFVAEVASITNESLLNNYLLNKVTDEREKLYLLNNYLENFRGTVFRQTMFAEFERDIHAYVEGGKALTADVLCKMYRELNVKYYGDALEIDAELDLEWARIPHFYYNFYVFQYATGFCCAASLADKILNEGPEALQNYKNFLSAGCSDYPIEVLKGAGVDMNTIEPVNNALNVFRSLVEEMEKLV